MWNVTFLSKNDKPHDTLSGYCNNRASRFFFRIESFTSWGSFSTIEITTTKRTIDMIKNTWGICACNKKRTKDMLTHKYLEHNSDVVCINRHSEVVVQVLWAVSPGAKQVQAPDRLWSKTLFKNHNQVKHHCRKWNCIKAFQKVGAQKT